MTFATYHFSPGETAADASVLVEAEMRAGVRPWCPGPRAGSAQSCKGRTVLQRTYGGEASGLWGRCRKPSRGAHARGAALAFQGKELYRSKHPRTRSSAPGVVYRARESQRRKVYGGPQTLDRPTHGPRASPRWGFAPAVSLRPLAVTVCSQAAAPGQAVEPSPKAVTAEAGPPLLPVSLGSGSSRRDAQSLPDLQ